MTTAKHSRLANLIVEVFPFMHRKLCNKSNMPLPPNQFITLILLHANGPMQISDTARQLGISKQQMTPLINRMQSSGYIIKQPSPHDKRINFIELTAKAQTLIEENHREISQILESKLYVLTNDEVDELTEKFSRCLELLKKIP